RDYTATYHLKKGVSKKLTFDFKEDVKIPEEGAYLGIEVINAPNNQNYEKFVQLECTSDKISTSEVVTVVNYAQEDGMIYNFDKKLKFNMYFEIKIPKP